MEKEKIEKQNSALCGLACGIFVGITIILICL